MIPVRQLPRRRATRRREIAARWKPDSQLPQLDSDNPCSCALCDRAHEVPFTEQKSTFDPKPSAPSVMRSSKLETNHLETMSLRALVAVCASATSENRSVLDYRTANENKNGG
jgi:hypothetical protein